MPELEQVCQTSMPAVLPVVGAVIAAKMHVTGSASLAVTSSNSTSGSNSQIMLTQ